ncbi:hypothetical protein [Pseudonocardia sp. GCM10023141]|uniref:hypothetical protein n=1 Tax=Pseudonocardia sp. GCM10023141 TaxID=3252653 RepID=UPI00361A2BA7
MAANSVLDEAYGRLHHTGPEFVGWLSNHGPMAADALIRIGRAGEVARWVDGYAQRLEEEPAPRWAIDAAGWREPLGDPSRLGDWLAFFATAVHAEPWEALLATWWPRLLPGAIASATHGLIRTGHAVRALREEVTAERLDDIPAAGIGEGGGTRTRLARVAASTEWPRATQALRPVTPAAAGPAALDELVDAAVDRYLHWAHGNPVMLVHAATAPRAAALVIPALPTQLWQPTYNTAWAVTAAISAAYRPADPAAPPAHSPEDPESVTDRAVAVADEHAIKFVEVALESHRRGNGTALAAADRASELIGRA